VSAGVVVALMLLSAIAVIAWRSINAFEDSARWVAHSYAVIAELGQLESGHSRMRLAWRTYLTSLAPDALDDYHASRQALAHGSERLDVLTQDNPDQHARIVALGDVIRQDMAASDVAIGHKVTGSLDASVPILQTISALRGSGERIARLAEGARGAERTLLAGRERATSAQGTQAKAWIVASSVGSLATLAAAFLVLRSEMARRSRAQSRIERYAAEVEELYHEAPCGYHSIDRNGVIVRINDTELAMLGYARDEIVGRMRAADLMTPESAGAFDARLSLAAGGVVSGAEYVCRRKDGSEFFARIDMGAGRAPGGAVGEYRAAVVDITRQKASENEVRALNSQLQAYSVRLEAINRELEGFSYSVSHDLRAPLRAINGFASMLEEDHAAQLDAEGRRLLGVVRTNADAMARLIDDLLAFSRLGKVAFDGAPVDMAALVREVLTERGSDAGVEIGDMPVAYGDRALLKQVWANLIDNAVKYSSNVAAPSIRVSGFVHDGGDTEYRIDDNGAGFDMRYYDKLFGVFQRLHAASEFPGTGVGLAIVQRIVARHGGRVWGEGRPGAGATFHFRLPCGEAHA
jgi:PAS domain S-box-containing protein